MRALNPQTPLVLLGNKADLVTERTITDADLQSVCGSLGSEKFFLTSAKTGDQVEDAFAYIAEIIENQK